MNEQKWENTPVFSFKGKKYNCKLLDVYDGDTVTICFYLEGFNYIRLNIRLLGIDTPELKGETKELGIETRNYLIKLLTGIEIIGNKTRKEIREDIFKSDNNTLDVIFDDFDKYGRPLAILEKNNININQKLVEEGYAKKYNGGTKNKW